MPPPNPNQAPFIDSFSGLSRPPAILHGWPLAQALLIVALVVPWVMPIAANPSPGVWSWLATASAVGVLLVCLAWAHPVGLTVETVRRGWVAAAVLSGAIGAVQYFGFSEHFLPWLNHTQSGEAFGNLRQRNQFASLMGIGLVAVIWCQGQNSGKDLRPFVILLALGNAASHSRTGALQWLAILAVALVYSVRGPRRPALTAAAALGVYLMWVLVLPKLLELLTGAHSGGLLGRFEQSPGCESRLVLWSNVIALIAEKPWFGWGWGELDYAHYMTLYPGERFCDILDNAHNLPLHLAVELGVPFSATVCAVLSWLVWRTRPWREADPSRQLAWAVLAVIGLHSLLEYPLWYGPFQMAAGLCVYLLWSTRAAQGDGLGISPRDRNGGAVRPGLAVAGSIILAGAAYVGWDYHRVSQIYLAPAQRDAAYRENTLEKIGATRLFRRQADFAALSLTPLTPASALQIYDQSTLLLHFSPEPRVIEKVIESAVMLRRDDEALLHLVRYRAAFPQNHSNWRSGLGITD